MLVDPVLDQTVNSEALDLLLYSPHSYNQMVQTCVSASQRVQGEFVRETISEQYYVYYMYQKLRTMIRSDLVILYSMSASSTQLV